MSNLSSVSTENQFCELSDAYIKVMGILSEKQLSIQEEADPSDHFSFLRSLAIRFQNPPRHYDRLKDVDYDEVSSLLISNRRVLWSILQMEESGGEPNIIDFDDNMFLFGDCSFKAPRKGLLFCDALKMSINFNIDMMSEDQYLKMQNRVIATHTIGWAPETRAFDRKTFTWLKTPNSILQNNQANCGRHFVREDPVVFPSTYNMAVLTGWRGVKALPRHFKII